MAKSIAALAAGLIFGAGLAISGMTDPAKVLGFLDLFGRWDPSLAFVMGGALAVAIPGYAWARTRGRPVLEPEFAAPASNRIDSRLIGGAAIFGVGWGLAGFCPGPAIANLSTGNWRVFVFVAAMLAGMAAFRAVGRPIARPARSA
jgi:uncharacterized protein